jgi:hypothetical protein
MKPSSEPVPALDCVSVEGAVDVSDVSGGALVPLESPVSIPELVLAVEVDVDEEGAESFELVATVEVGLMVTVEAGFTAVVAVVADGLTGPVGWDVGVEAWVDV